MLQILGSLIVATYSVALPILIRCVHQLRVDKAHANNEIKESLSTMFKKIDSLNTTVSKLNEKQDFNEAMTSRYRIIRAADEIRNGNDLSDEHLEQLGEDCEIYQGYCDTHPDYKNHKGQKSMKLVLSYESKQLEGSV